jgi:hypothetical protein
MLKNINNMIAEYLLSFYYYEDIIIVLSKKSFKTKLCDPFIKFSSSKSIDKYINTSKQSDLDDCEQKKERCRW